MERRHLTFRPSPDSPSALPLAVRSVGSYSLSKGRGLKQMRKHHFQLYWGIEGTGQFRRAGRDYHLGAAQTFVYLSGDLHDYEATSECWTYCFIALDGTALESILAALGFTSQVSSARNCPRALFEQLHLLVPRHTPEDEMKASALAYDILLQATLPPNAPETDFARQAQRMIEEHAHDPNFGIEQVAANLDVHRTTLLRQFKAQFRMTPSEYLSRVRINAALELLQNTNKPLTDIAAETGFSDLSYFGKVIHRITGQSPSELRQ